MAMGRRPEEWQAALFIPAEELARSPGHPFYCKLNELLAEAGFDLFVENLCRPYYEAGGPGRPSIAPGTYFRMLFIGYFEGLDSQRAIDWKCADSLSLREFLGVPLTEKTPDHSTLSKTRQRLPQPVHERVFQFVLKLANDKQLLSAKTVGVDSTTLEANAAMKTIVRKETGEEYQEFLRRLAEEVGLENPDDEQLRRFDKRRKGKTCSNAEWESPTDRDARIAKMKDGTTHLAYKAEHVVDLESEFILAAEIRPATDGDAETLVDSVLSAQGHLDAAATLTAAVPSEEETAAAVGAGLQIEEVAADKGYHAAATLELAADLQLRTYIPEPERPHRSRWTDKPPAYQQAVYANRRRVRRAKNKQLQRLRSERVERSFAHVCETGSARRTWLRGLIKVAKRYLMQAAARNLGLILLNLFGTGKPRGLQDLCAGLFGLLRKVLALWTTCRRLMSTLTLFDWPSRLVAPHTSLATMPLNLTA